MFPERQLGPHRDWKQEVEFLDRIFKNGAAYTIGKVNGDHWLLYLTDAGTLSLDSNPGVTPHVQFEDRHVDYTIEILMSDLSPKSRQPFFFAEGSNPDNVTCSTPAALATDLSEKLGITEIFPSSLTHLDAYAFQPCGYSSNALIKWGHESLEDNFVHQSLAPGRGAGHCGEGYYTIHVTPEEGWSYASFECNVPLSTTKVSQETKIPDLQLLIKRVVNIFEPGRITLTLFISSEDNDTGGEPAVEAAQRAFKTALSECPRTSSECTAKSDVQKKYRRTDKINYEFGGYDLAFASFELK